MRVNEALGLELEDVNLREGILHIRRTKFGKSRYVPVHPSTVKALRRYAAARDRLVPAVSLLRSLSRSGVAGLASGLHDTPLPSYPSFSVSACPLPGTAMVHGFMTCDIDLLPARWSSGTDPGSMWSKNFRS
jgi:hypothetical protein